MVSLHFSLRRDAMSAVQARCPICTSQFHTNSIGALPCGHTFHHQCVLQWIQNSKTCPICRVRVTERQLIKQLYFDTSEESSSQSEGVNYAAKAEELSISLEQERSKQCKTHEDLIRVKKELDSVSDKLEREKLKTAKKLPALEAERNHLKMMLEDQNDLKAKYRQAQDRLKACDFYTLLVRGHGDEAEAAIDKYIKKDDQLQENLFMKLMKRQVEAEKKKSGELDAKLRKYLERFQDQQKKIDEQKGLIQTLKAEADELRSAANKSNSTPYNPKLKSLFNQRSPKRLSIGFNQSHEFSDDLIESAVKPIRPMVGGGIQKVEKKPSPLTKPSFSGIVSENFFDWDSQEIVPSGSSTDQPLPFPCLDDTMDSCSDLQVPESVMRRLRAGSPKRRTNAVGAIPRVAVRIMDNNAFGYKPSVNRQLKRTNSKQKHDEPAAKTQRISSFFPRNKSNSNIQDDVISLD